MKTLVLFLAILISSCNMEAFKIPKPPFIVTEAKITDNGEFKYRVVDSKNPELFDIIISSERWSVGDTITIVKL